MRGFSILIVCVGMAFAIPQVASAAATGVAWTSRLQVLPGMEGQLPTGISNGQTISGYFLYDTGADWFGRANNWTSVSYYSLGWQMNLGGGNVMGRRADDGRGGMESTYPGALSIRNNNATYHDSIEYSAWFNPYDPLPYFYLISIMDMHNTALSSSNPPAVIDFGQFEVVKIDIYKTRFNLGMNDHIKIASMTSSDILNLTQVPEPLTLAMMAVGVVMVRRGRT